MLTLGPLLFSVFVKDTLRVAGVRLFLFADDTAAFVTETNPNFASIKLQSQLDAYVGWAENWRVAVNANKSTAVIFSAAYCNTNRVALDQLREVSRASPRLPTHLANLRTEDPSTRLGATR